MLTEQVKIKINQFILAYERQCAQIQFQNQNIKQNVMLSIIQKRNTPKNIIQEKIIEKSILKSPRNISSNGNNQSLLIKEAMKIDKDLNKQSSIKNNNINQLKILQKSNLMTKSKQNNFFFPEDQKYENKQTNNQSNQLQIKKNQQFQIEDVDNNQSQIIVANSRLYNKSQLPNFEQKNKYSQIHKKQGSYVNVQKSKIQQSKIYEKNKSNKDDEIMDSKSLYQQSKVFPKVNSSKIHAKSQKNLQGNQLFEQNSASNIQNYPTFQKPSFQFITNLSQLRQSDRNYHQNNQQYDYQQQAQQYQANKVQYQNQQKSNKYGKWNSKAKHQQIQQNQQNQHQNQYEDEQNNYQQNNHPNVLTLQQNQSVMQISQAVKKASDAQQTQYQRKNIAFQVNIDRSNINNTQNLQQLKKRKILQLQRKRHERMQNLSRQKNQSQISKNQNSSMKRLPSYHGSNSRIRKDSRQNRDSLNKSVNQKQKDKQKNKIKSKISLGNNFNINKDDQNNNNQTNFNQNKTILSKYVQQSRVNNINNIQVSPFSASKTGLNTQKRPPMHKNRKQDGNIFIPTQSNTPFHRQKSLHKISQPKIQPKIQKSTFQKQSNKKLMINSIIYVCLPGELNRKQRQKLIEVMQKYENQFFIFLFKEYSRKVIKGIYILDVNQTKLFKIYGDKAPQEIVAEQVLQFYRFDSGSREFKKIDGCRSFSFSIHAIDMK